MSTLELKNILKEKIDKLEENYLLEHLIGIIEVETSMKTFELPESHKESIDAGLTQIEAGKSLTNREVIKKVQRWAEK